MIKQLYLFICVIITSSSFVLFFSGARKIGQKPVIWGVIGGSAFLVPCIVLSPIAWNLFQSSLDPSVALLFSYYFIVIAAAVAIAVIVYRRFLIKGK
jgi:hypothetical protein